MLTVDELNAPGLTSWQILRQLFFYQNYFILGEKGWNLMGDDIETGRSTSFKNWAAHVGGAQM